MRPRMVAVGACALVACGGGGGAAPTGSGTAGGTGTVGAFNLAVNDAVAFQFSGPACSGSSQQTGAIIVLTSATGLCALAQQPSAKAPDSRNLVLIVVNDGSGSQPALTTGTFNVHIGPPMPELLGAVTQVTNGCSKNNPSYLTSGGTVTITSIDSSGITGSYNLTFVDQANAANAAGTLSGNFHAANCTVPSSFICSTSSPGC